MKTYYSSIFPHYTAAKKLSKSINVTVDVQNIVSPQSYNDQFVFNKSNEKLALLKLEPYDLYIPAVDNSRTRALVHFIKNNEYNVSFNVTSIDYLSVALGLEEDVKNGYVIRRFESNSIIEEESSLDAVNYFLSGDIQELLEYTSKNTLSYSNSIVDPILSDSSVQITNENTTIGDIVDRLNEEIAFEPPSSSEMPSFTKVDDVFGKLKVYFATGNMPGANYNRIPVLMGPTGVAKSSLIKQMARTPVDSDQNVVNFKYSDGEDGSIDFGREGYRLIDFRVAFLDNLDVNGLSKIKTNDDPNSEFYGEKESEFAPHVAFAGGTDEMVDLNRRIYIKLHILQAAIKNEITKNPDDALINKSQAIKKLLDSYWEACKPPLIFLDEITRVQQASVRSAILKFITNKSYAGKKITYGRLVAATNIPHGLDEKQMEEFGDLYLTDESDDLAFKERLQPIIVAPVDVENRWLDWGNKVERHCENCKGKRTFTISDIKGFAASTGTIVCSTCGYTYNDISHLDTRLNLHPIVSSYCDNRRQDIYRMTAKTRDEALTQPFPNYRTWEFVSKYIYDSQVVEGDKIQSIQYDPEMIKKLIGDNSITDLFLKYLDKYGGTPSKNSSNAKDPIAARMMNSINSGVPYMVAGPTGFGKTARVHEIAKALNADVFEIDLSTIDRTDINGAPSIVNVKDLFLDRVKAFAGNDQDILDAILNEFSADKYEGFQNLTTWVPNSSLRRSIEKAKASGRKIVLFFDEMNRCSPEVMSSVFEAISDHRYQGVEFDPKQVSIVSAINYGAEYGDVGDLDPAFVARFAFDFKHGYDDNDVDAIRAYMKEKGYDPAITTMFDEMENAEIIEMLQSVSEKSISTGAPSLRAFQDLSTNYSVLRKDPKYNGSLWFKHPVSGMENLLKVTIGNVNASSSEQREVFLNADGSPKDSAKVALDSLNSISDTYIGFKSENGVKAINTLKSILTSIIDNKFNSKNYDDGHKMIKEIDNALSVYNNWLTKVLLPLEDIRMSFIKSLTGDIIGEKLQNKFANSFFKDFDTLNFSDILFFGKRDVIIDYFIKTKVVPEYDKLYRIIGDHFGNIPSIAPEHAADILLKTYNSAAYSKFGLTDTFNNWIKKMVSDGEFVALLANASRRSGFTAEFSGKLFGEGYDLSQYNGTLKDSSGKPLPNFIAIAEGTEQMPDSEEDEVSKALKALNHKVAKARYSIT